MTWRWHSQGVFLKRKRTELHGTGRQSYVWKQPFLRRITQYKGHDVNITHIFYWHTWGYLTERKSRALNISTMLLAKMNESCVEPGRCIFYIYLAYGWFRPTQLAWFGSGWTGLAPIAGRTARNLNVVSTCLGTGNACLLLVLCPNMGCRSTHSSKRTALRSKSSSSSRPVDPDGLWSLIVR